MEEVQHNAGSDIFSYSLFSIYVINLSVVSCRLFRKERRLSMLLYKSFVPFGRLLQLMLTRMLQLLPFVCKHIPMAFRNALFGNLHPSRNSMNWFHEFLALGGLASRAVLRWWQNAACAIVDNLVQSGSLSSSLKDIISDFLKPGIKSSFFSRLLCAVDLRWGVKSTV